MQSGSPVNETRFGKAVTTNDTINSFDIGSVGRIPAQAFPKSDAQAPLENSTRQQVAVS
jgi:hypothetical protein